MALLLFYRAYIIKLLFSALFPLCEKIFHATLFKKPNEKLSAKASAGSFPVHVILDIFRFAFPSPKKKSNLRFSTTTGKCVSCLVPCEG